MKSSKKLLLVAEDGNKILGFTSAEIRKGSDMYVINTTGLIEYLFIKEGSRRKGVGKVLLKEVLDWFKIKRIEYILIAVHSKNLIGRKAWKKYGFTEFMSKQRIKI